ncbi:hypothetical protein Tcan_05607 [Toxocara canis]|uniref:Uncharacterized protein n=1 Tax=Toxocara canis TaxID=6265 RepID=A0A0B2V3X9_TOXCA|nr:hypothetical protein Tcan_05607 [Toxocara canis]
MSLIVLRACPLTTYQSVFLPHSCPHPCSLLFGGSATASPPSAAHPESAASATDQKHESMAEGFTSEDGSTVVSKKMTRVVTTTRTALPGETSEPNAGE